MFVYGHGAGAGTWVCSIWPATGNRCNCYQITAEIAKRCMYVLWLLLSLVSVALCFPLGTIQCLNGLWDGANIGLVELNVWGILFNNEMCVL